MTTTFELIFVYGTLKRGCDHPMARHLAENADWIGSATCLGRLYRISTYPGLKLSSDPSDIVHGDLYALRDDDLIAVLDDYEGCGANDPQPHPYSRLMIDVEMSDGTNARAWTYVYQGAVGDLPLIDDGRFTMHPS